jgi:hypothetical protein
MRFASSALLLAFAAPSFAADAESRIYEMRVYHTAPGKLDALNARFRDHTMKLFEKHGMTNIGYFVPIDNKDNLLVYFLAFPSRAARDKSFKEFAADPAWQAARKESEKNGKLVNKVDSTFLVPTDYSPAIRPTTKAGERVFELRTYTTPPGRLDALNARFRDHTMKLFTKHGMTNIAYWTLAPGQKGVKTTLVYLLAHKSEAARNQSFDTFRKDPAWVAAKDASEQKAGGPLTVKDGVKSLMLKPTDYSPLK